MSYDYHGHGHYGYGCAGYNPCKPKCGYGCGYSSYCPSSPPSVAGTWNLHYSQLAQSSTSAATCGDVEDVTASMATNVVITQCGKPDNIFVTIAVISGPTGPLNPGNQLIGVFRKDSRNCWTLIVPSVNDNTTFQFNFKGGHCPKKLNFSYSKPVDPSSMDGTVVGGGHGDRVH